MDSGYCVSGVAHFANLLAGRYFLVDLHHYFVQVAVQVRTPVGFGYYHLLSAVAALAFRRRRALSAVALTTGKQARFTLCSSRDGIGLGNAAGLNCIDWRIQLPAYVDSQVDSGSSCTGRALRLSDSCFCRPEPIALFGRRLRICLRGRTREH